MNAFPRTPPVKAARRIRLLAAGAMLSLAACAPPLRDPWGLSIRRGETPAPRALPKTLQVDLGLQPGARGSLPLSARLYAEPPAESSAASPASPASSGRYRLDVFGFPSQIAASWLWDKGEWILVRHDKREARAGKGPLPEQEGLPVRLSDVHEALGFLWGEPLPGFASADTAFSVGADGVVRWRRNGEPWEATLDSATGLCREARSPHLTLRYRRHHRQDDLVVAAETEVYAGEESLLVLRVRDWVASPPWKKDPFLLRVPEGYERRE